jgi:aminoglycoside/choline kinase family phosphotransferase
MSLQGSSAEPFDGLDLRIRRYLDRRTESGELTRKIVPLVGDASTRRYFRLFLDGESLILAVMPDPFDPEDFPFLNVAELLRHVPLRIPEIRDVSGPEGLLLLEDLGDELLQQRVEVGTRREKKSLYREALLTLNLLQQRGEELRDDRYLPYSLAFDEKKLFDELVFFERHFLIGFRGVVLTSADQDALESEFRAIARELSHRPRVLCHRDYHSRNLMVLDGELGVIDFQDARMGPMTYDLVSLVRDSYVEHDEEFVGEMVEEFRRGVKGIEVPHDFDSELGLMSLQRNLKALGTFGYQISVRGNDVYEPYVSPTLELVRSNMAKNRRSDGLRKILSAYLTEIS